jgi:hypothetical protein
MRRYFDSLLERCPTKGKNHRGDGCGYGEQMLGAGASFARNTVPRGLGLKVVTPPKCIQKRREALRIAAGLQVNIAARRYWELRRAGQSSLQRPPCKLARTGDSMRSNHDKLRRVSGLVDNVSTVKDTSWPTAVAALSDRCGYDIST